MRGKSIALLMLALGCGLVAAIGITKVLAERNEKAVDVGEGMQSVLVASRDISMGNVIDSAAVKIEAWPKDKVPPGTLTKLEEAEGRRARGLIVAGEPILDKKLRVKGLADSGVSFYIPKGYRVVSVKVDSVSSGSGLIQPGDRVDMLVSLERNPGRGILETGTVTILQDIRVFAVNNDVEMDKEGSKDGKDNRGIQVQTISLLVTPKQANMVTLASEMGRIRLTMRPRDDDARVENTTANPTELFGPSLVANRKKEERRDSDVNSSATGGILDIFKKPQGASKTGATPPEDLPNVWIVHILQPDGVDEVTLEEDRTPNAPKGGIWRMSNSNTVISSKGSDVKSRPLSSKPSVAPPPTLPLPPAPLPEPKASPAPEPKKTPAPADAPAEPQQDPTASDAGETNPNSE